MILRPQTRKVKEEDLTRVVGSACFEAQRATASTDGDDSGSE